MDSEHWISCLAAAKRFYAAQLGHADRAGMDELDMDSDENAARPDFACPYCYEDHDVASLIAHLKEEHPFEPHAAVSAGGAPVAASLPPPDPVAPASPQSSKPSSAAGASSAGHSQEEMHLIRFAAMVMEHVRDLSSLTNSEGLGNFPT